MNVIIYAKPLAKGEALLGLKISSDASMFDLNLAANTLAAGLMRRGHKVIWRNPNAFTGSQTEACDLAVAIGMQRTGKAVADAYREAKVPALIIDLGFYGRVPGPDCQFQLGLGRLNWLPPIDCPADRAEALGMVAPDVQETVGGHILICGQKPGDAQHNITDMEKWLAGTVAMVREHSDAPIAWRPHPSANKAAPKIGGICRIDLPGEVALDESLAGAALMVTHNSTAAYQAFVMGVPVLCDPSAVYAPAAMTSFGAAEPSREAIQSILNRVAYGQWSFAEMAGGEPAGFMSRFISSERESLSEPETIDELRHSLTTLQGRLDLAGQENTNLSRAVEKLTVKLQASEQVRAGLEAKAADLTQQAEKLKAQNQALKASFKKSARKSTES